MHWEIRSVVHNVTKRSNDPELSIPAISILRNPSEVGHQARSAGAIFYAKCFKCMSAERQHVRSAYMRSPADYLALSFASYDTGHAGRMHEMTKPWKLSFCIWLFGGAANSAAPKRKT